MSIKGIPFLTLTEAAAEIGITPGRLRQMLRMGEVKGLKAGPRAWLIQANEVKRLKRPVAQGRGRPRVGTK